MNFPSKILEKAVEEIAQLPGIGKRTALRLALHLLNNPNSKAERLASSLNSLVNEIVYCKECYNFSDFEVCEICSNPLRDKTIICIVEDVRDVMAIEETNQYKGVYHVLGGRISPMDGIGPLDLKLNELITRVNNHTKEILFALSSTMEGDTTMFYIYNMLKDLPLNFSTIARGIGVGDELEYADGITLARSITNRVPYNGKVE